MLAARPVTYADEMLRDSLHAPHTGDAIPLGSGYPDPALCPSEELAALAAQITRDNPRTITDYLQVEGLPELRERLAELGRAAGYATSADEILVTTRRAPGDRPHRPRAAGSRRRGRHRVADVRRRAGVAAVHRRPRPAAARRRRRPGHRRARAHPRPPRGQARRAAGGLPEPDRRRPVAAAPRAPARARPNARLLRPRRRRLRDDALRRRAAAAPARGGSIARHLRRLALQDDRRRPADRLDRRAAGRCSPASSS